LSAWSTDLSAWSTAAGIRILDVTGAARVIKIFDTREQALAFLDGTERT
jgi:hypothetical protein